MLNAVERQSGACGNLGAFGSDVAQAFFQRDDLAQPGPRSRLGQSSAGVGLDVIQPGQLGRVKP
jgi:hypothetical protein